MLLHGLFDPYRQTDTSKGRRSKERGGPNQSVDLHDDGVKEKCPRKFDCIAAIADEGMPPPWKP